MLDQPFFAYSDRSNLKVFVIFTTFDAVFYEQIHDYNPFSFTIPFAV